MALRNKKRNEFNSLKKALLFCFFMISISPFSVNLAFQDDKGEACHERPSFSFSMLANVTTKMIEAWGNGECGKNVNDIAKKTTQAGNIDIKTFCQNATSRLKECPEQEAYKNIANVGEKCFKHYYQREKGIDQKKVKSDIIKDAYDHYTVLAQEYLEILKNPNRNYLSKLKDSDFSCTPERIEEHLQCAGGQQNSELKKTLSKLLNTSDSNKAFDQFNNNILDSYLLTLKEFNTETDSLARDYKTLETQIDNIISGGEAGIYYLGNSFTISSGKSLELNLMQFVKAGKGETEEDVLNKVSGALVGADFSEDEKKELKNFLMKKYKLYQGLLLVTNQVSKNFRNDEEKAVFNRRDLHSFTTKNGITERDLLASGWFSKNKNNNELEMKPSFASIIKNDNESKFKKISELADVWAEGIEMEFASMHARCTTLKENIDKIACVDNTDIKFSVLSTEAAKFCIIDDKNGDKKADHLFTGPEKVGLVIELCKGQSGCDGDGCGNQTAQKRKERSKNRPSAKTAKRSSSSASSSGGYYKTRATNYKISNPVRNVANSQTRESLTPPSEKKGFFDQFFGDDDKAGEETNTFPQDFGLLDDELDQDPVEDESGESVIDDSLESLASEKDYLARIKELEAQLAKKTKEINEVEKNINNANESEDPAYREFLKNLEEQKNLLKSERENLAQLKDSLLRSSSLKNASSKTPVEDKIKRSPAGSAVKDLSEVASRVSSVGDKTSQRIETADPSTNNDGNRTIRNIDNDLYLNSANPNNYNSQRITYIEQLPESEAILTSLPNDLSELEDQVFYLKLDDSNFVKYTIVDGEAVLERVILRKSEQKDVGQLINDSSDENDLPNKREFIHRHDDFNNI